MNENNKNEYEKIPDFKIPSPREQAACNLRALMLSKDGDEKCILCKAAEELEKTENNGKNWMGDFWFFAIFMMFSGFGNGFEIDPDGMKAYMDAVEKKKEQGHA